MEDKKYPKYLLVGSVAIFALTILYSLGSIRIPNYGGDELWFATPLLTVNIGSLGLFQFVYAGPLKTIITVPIFEFFGFNIYTVRVFTIGVYIVGVTAWSIYLKRKQYWAALSATLLFFSLNYDLTFFAKVDINEPTFYNTIIILYFLVYLKILHSGNNRWRSFLFIFLSLIEVNNHIRNIWIVNALLVTTIIDYYVVHNKKKLLVWTIYSVIRNRWPIVFGWLLSVLYFLYVLIHFNGSPSLEAAKALGHNISWPDRLLWALRAFAEYFVGGMVFSHAYAGLVWQHVIVGVGSLLLLVSGIYFVLCLMSDIDDQWLKRLLVITTSILCLVFIQYAVTKSAKWPWHGNCLLLFSSLFFGLLLQCLYSAHKVEGVKGYAIKGYVALTIGIMMSINVAAENQMVRPAIHHRGFNLAIWNLQALDNIRDYIREKKGVFYVADWGIGRPLALEYLYRRVKGIDVKLALAPMSPNVVSEYAQGIIIRSTDTSRTVPNYSDEAITRIGKNLHFVVLKSFYDVYGREVYQAGYIQK